MINVEGPYREISVSLARWTFSENEVYNSPGLNFYKSPFLSKFKSYRLEILYSKNSNRFFSLRKLYQQFYSR